MSYLDLKNSYYELINNHELPNFVWESRLVWQPPSLISKGSGGNLQQKNKESLSSWQEMIQFN